MPVRKPISKRTRGYNATTFIGEAVAYNPSTNPLYKDFVDKAPLGTVGLFKIPLNGDESSATRVAGSLSEGEKFFIAQVMSNVGDNRGAGPHIKKSKTLDLKSISRKTKNDFILPASQLTHIGYNGVGGDLEFVSGAIVRDYDYSIAILETSEENQPYPTWQYNYQPKSSDTSKDIAFGIAEKANNPFSLQNKEASPLVTIEVLIKGQEGAITETFDVEEGSNVIVASAASHGLIVGDILQLTVGTSKVSYLVEKVDTTDITLNTGFIGKTATGLAGDILTAIEAVGLQIKSIYEDVHFRVSVRGELEDSAIYYTSPYSVGSGSRTQVERMEYEGNIFDGGTTIHAKYAPKYGELNRFRKDEYAYEVINLQYVAEYESVAIPNTTDSHLGYIEFALPITSGALTDEGYVNAPASPLSAVKSALGL